MAEVVAAGRRQGLGLTVTTFGPFFRAVARLEPAAGAAEPAGGEVVGYVAGFTAPGPAPLGLLHLDTMQVFNSRIPAAERARARGVWGAGLLLGAAAVCHGHERGCRKAELLAIDDSNAYYGKLVRYYERMGFRRVREVGAGGLGDLPHLLVWGGAGMRMDGDLPELMERWAPLIRAMAKGPPAGRS